MTTRWILALTGLMLSCGVARAQPWPTKDAKADNALEALLTAGVNTAVLKKTAAAEGVRWETVDAAKLAQGLRTAKSTITTAVRDAAVLQWRDEPANRPFWTAYLGAIAKATDGPRGANSTPIWQERTRRLPRFAGSGTNTKKLPASIIESCGPAR